MEELRIKEIVREVLSEVAPKEWLTRENLEQEFGVKTTTLWKMENRKVDPLPYTSLGDRKHLYHRKDIEAILEKNKRNAR